MALGACSTARDDVVERAAERLLGGYWPSLTASCSASRTRSPTSRLEDAETVLAETLRGDRDARSTAGARAATCRSCSCACAAPSTSSGCWRGSGRSADELDGIVLPKVGGASAARFLAIMRARAARPRPAAVGDADPRGPGHRAPRAAAGGAARPRRTCSPPTATSCPCVRIGATDLCGLWGLRRSRDFTVYDLAAVRGRDRRRRSTSSAAIRRRPGDQRAGLGVHPRRAGVQAAAARDAVHRGVRRRTARASGRRC